MPEPQINTPRFPRSVFSNEEFKTVVDAHRGDSGTEDPLPGATSMIVNTLAQEYDPSYFSLPTLMDGTAGIYEDLGTQFKGKPPEERQLKYDQILKLFVRNEEGEAPEDGSFTKGVVRKALSGALSVPAFKTGAKVAGTAVQTIAGGTVPGAVARTLTPFVGGVVAVGPAIMAGDWITELALGPEELLVPGTEGPYVAGKIFAENVPMGAYPLFMKSKANLGYDLAIKQMPTSGLRELDIAFSKKMPSSKVLKFTKGMENLLDRLSLEGKGLVKNKAGDLVYSGRKQARFLAAETTAALGGAAAVGSLSEEQRESLPVSLATEVGGSVFGGYGGDIIFKKLIAAWDLAATGVRSVRSGGLKRAYEGFKQRNEMEITNFILDALEKSGEDIGSILKKLDDDTLEKLAIEQNIAPIKLTGGVKSASPTLLALEKSLEILGKGGVKDQRISANTEGAEILKNGILALYDTGDPDGIQQAAELFKNVFELQMQGEVDAARKTLVAAVDKLKTGSPSFSEPERLALLGEKLFDIVKTKLGTDRAKERYLWQSVGGENSITTFINAKGEETNVPNFVTMWDRILRSTPEANINTNNALKSLIDFTNRKKKELGLSGGNVNASEATLTFRKVLSDMMKEPELTVGVGGETSVDKFNSALELEVLRVINNVRLPSGGIDEAVDSMMPEQVQSLISELSKLEINNMSPDPKMSAQLRKKTAQFAKLIRFKRLELLDKKNNLDAIASDSSNLQPVTARELIDMRSRALALGKSLQAKGDFEEASAAFRYASALLADLDSFPEGDNLQYDIARSFSKALNDTYTRSYIGKTLETKRTGGYKLEAEHVAMDLFNSNKGYTQVKALDDIGKFQLEQSLTNLLSTNKERGAELLQSAKEAAFDDGLGVFDVPLLQTWLKNNKEELSSMPGFLRKVDSETDEIDVEAVSNTLFDNISESIDGIRNTRSISSNILRQIKAETFEADGTFNPKTLAKWMNKSTNKDLLSLFPDIKKDMDDLISGDTSKLNLFNETKEMRDAKIREEKRFASVYDLLPESTENPTTAITKALSPSNSFPVKSFNKLYKAVKDAPDSWINPATGNVHTKIDAQKGFQTAVLETIIGQATNSKGKIDALTLYRNLFAPLSKSKSKLPLSEVLVNQEIFNQTQIDQIEDLMGKMVELDGTLLTGNAADVDDLMAKLGPSADLILSVLGSSAGARLQQLMPGDSGVGTLIASGRGASVFRNTYSNIFATMPNVFKSDLLKETLQNPELLAATLRKGRNVRQNKNVGGRMIEILIDNGVIPIFRRTADPLITTSPEEFISDETSLNEGQDEIKKPFMLSLENQFFSDASPSMNAVRGGPQPVAQATPPASPPAQADPQTRQRYAALFPNDPTSAMIKGSQGGIGSLFG